MRKASVSLYIILGITLILIFAIFSFTNKSIYEFEKDVLPERLKKHPVISFVDECVKETAFQGIKSISSNGGFLYYPEMSFNSDPIKSSGVFIGDTFIPYWYYINKDNKFSSEKPALCESNCEISGENSIEEQLRIFMDKNLGKCINNFEQFKDQYEIKSETFINEPIIRDNDILIKVSYPLEIISKQDNSKEFLKNFNTKIDLDFKEIYSFAHQITQTQIQNNFIENHILNMLALYSGMDSELPPMAHLQIGSNDLKFWIRSNVEEIIKNDILDFVRLIQVVNTDSFNPMYLLDRTGVNEIRQGVYNSMSFRVSEDQYNDMEVNFLYPFTNIELNIGDSELIFPENKIPMRNFIFDLLHFSIYDYSFDYDLAFPVLINIKKKDAYNGREIIFRFAIEANIRNNLPLTTEFDLNTQKRKSTPIFKHPDQLINRTIELIVTDKSTSDPIDDVNIYYMCGEKAYLGKTNNGRLSTKLPFCMFGGLIIAEKSDYLSDIIEFDNLEESLETEFNFELYKGVKKDVEIRKIDSQAFKKLSSGISPLIDLKEYVYLNSKPIDKNENIILNIERKNEHNEQNRIPLLGLINYKQGDFDYTKLIKNEIETQYLEGEITIEERDTLLEEIKDLPTESLDIEPLMLVPGEYYVEAYVINEGNFTIPEKIEEVCPCSEILGVCICDKEEVIYPEQKFATYPTGGVDAIIKINEQDLYSDKNKIVFYVFTDEIPKTWDDFETIKQIDDFTEYNYLLNPRFVE